MTTSRQAVLIVGASVGGVRCALGLRDAGFSGPITLLDVESSAPYDKPQLSKHLGKDDALELLATPELLHERDIEFQPGTTAVGLDLAGRVETTSGLRSYDHLVIASGCRPRELLTPLPLHASYVRTQSNWERLKSAAERGGRLLVVGAGFLGLEAAAAGTGAGMSATVIDVAPKVLQRGIPGVAADLIAARHSAEGVDLRMGVGDATLGGDRDHVWVDGVKGDFAVVSIGAVPNVEWLEGSGLILENGVVCDETLSAAQGVWAVGDCARWHNSRYDRMERVEHWTTAVKQAQHVASSIATGEARAFGDVPYVWSDQFNWKIQTVGKTAVGAMHYVSDNGAHVVLSTDGDRVTGVTTINAQAICLRARQLLQGGDPSLDDVAAGLHLDKLTLVA
ncbi:NAD(P)/FAD-dependent oxidoreductase [Nocardioides panzhihuensis]|uniref:NADPH-dependent 2,4-dienoyl-CoA reductase/sulfur reductase-like enzyme n=1 Tax=Nocardioides panzhihuensis TaxID=860243 RepID=A0A7Z0IUN3_9ACTN|nr:FAD-dependent oxidoreductase [Nocardioides panzhihuensis]NYI80389.1 NADPH-dependent 2,4-dienoyl-CoA reductase/sulfur reductase-like enzyme [Nocardioides panzhihuensis]